MAADPARLYQLLLNTGLQIKDNALHQVIHSMIGSLVDVNKTITIITSGSGGGGSGTIGPQGIQGIAGLNGLDSIGDIDEPILITPATIQDIISLFNNGDILVGGLSGKITSIPDVAVNSVLISKGVGVVPSWSDSVNFGTSGSGFLNIAGNLAITKTFFDDGVIPLTTSLTFPTVTTAIRTAVNYDVTSAGSSSFSQVGCRFTLEPGYTGTSQTYALIIKNGVATTHNQAVGIQSNCLAAGLSNCAISGIANNGTNGNIGVYGGIGGFTEGNFNFNITAAILASNGATGNDIYRGYSSTNLRFSVTDAGNVVAVGSLSGTSYIHSGAEIDKTYQIYTPLTLATVTMSAGQSRAIINPAGTIAVLTVTLPSSPVDGQVAGISFTQIVTALTINAPGGATVVGPPTSAAVNNAFRFIYQASSTSWFPAA